MKYRIMQGKGGVFRAIDERDCFVINTYATTVEECESLLRKSFELGVDTEKVWKEIEL